MLPGPDDTITESETDSCNKLKKDTRLTAQYQSLKQMQEDPLIHVVGPVKPTPPITVSMLES